MSLEIAARTDVCSFKVAILFFYESALGAKGLENDRMIETALGVDETGRERSCKSALY